LNEFRIGSGFLRRGVDVAGEEVVDEDEKQSIDPAN
jgi:hypothetical protein